MNSNDLDDVKNGVDDAADGINDAVDNVDDAVSKVEAIIKAEKCRVDRIEEIIIDTKEEEIHQLLKD